MLLIKRDREKRRPVKGLSEAAKAVEKRSRRFEEKVSELQMRAKKKSLKNHQRQLPQLLASMLFSCSFFRLFPSSYLATIASLCRTKSSPSPLHSSSFLGALTDGEAALTFSFLATTAAFWRETSSECVVT